MTELEARIDELWDEGRVEAEPIEETIDLQDVAPALQPSNGSRRRAAAEPEAGPGPGATPAAPRSDSPSIVPQAFASAPEGEAFDAVMPLEEAERRAIVAALRQAAGNKNEAARLLKIDRQRLYRKLDKYTLR